ncbi:YtpR family tRNA-binding protein [Ligilactobacillus aviarius]|uniref:tRNA-binding protein n=1 Tax=Ligilactobacillus aviarius TaxID=1606 RepID=A0A179C857_9LACO|nr:DUF4479 and tRNA-binding domain-containing protein [Ligilactobacillus aviarius]OAP97515.1 tRNA-binding protein [Ligilactobacillus aviarius]OAQ00814.1 tRNA-binding protein [Ligilactobacillus aviarius]OAQ01079.1 tRNA-binding protein [Ligilactobacillus aviarius]OAQ06167.1 tRNA-binding protein [Ligilactobacillus aviarius]OAQ08614.1 tRNA-binding protein [Ligilactobacillus aviarius]
MLISSYNPEHLGDVLITMIKPDVAKQSSEKKENVVRIFNRETNETIGYNFFDVSQTLTGLNGQGQVLLTADQVKLLNELLTKVGFEDLLEEDQTPKFVVGYVEEMEAHPDSDHLHVTKTRVDNDQVLQIVCGAPNIEQGQTVVVAKEGAMMPTGAMIWNGKLRGVESDGMICSARELGLPNAPQKRGILVLPTDEYHVGDEFDFDKAATLFTKN